MTGQSLKFGKIMTNQVANTFGIVQLLSYFDCCSRDSKMPKRFSKKKKKIYFRASIMDLLINLKY